METKEITVTFRLPRNFNSLHQLEMAIHTQGQRIKQQLFQEEVQAIIDERKENVSDEAVACLHCQKKTAYSSATSQDN